MVLFLEEKHLGTFIVHLLLLSLFIIKHNFFIATKIQVAFWMAGKTCGICGKYDAEKEREYQMPSGYLAKDAVSFGQSWIISEDPCAGGTKILIYINVIAFD